MLELMFRETMSISHHFYCIQNQIEAHHIATALDDNARLRSLVLLRIWLDGARAPCKVLSLETIRCVMIEMPRIWLGPRMYSNTMVWTILFLTRPHCSNEQSVNNFLQLLPVSHSLSTETVFSFRKDFSCVSSCSWFRESEIPSDPLITSLLILSSMSHLVSASTWKWNITEEAASAWCAISSKEKWMNRILDVDAVAFLLFHQSNKWKRKQRYDTMNDRTMPANHAITGCRWEAFISRKINLNSLKIKK